MYEMKKILCGMMMMASMVMLSGCDITKSLQSAYNITNCDYKYKSITGLTVSGMNLSNGISALQLPQILAILSGSAKSIPLDFTLNLDVHNPNLTQAAFHALPCSPFPCSVPVILSFWREMGKTAFKSHKKTV